MRLVSASLLSVFILPIALAVPAAAKQCGNNSSGYNAWIQAFSQEAVRKGIRPATLNAAFSGASYSRKTISIDRGQKSFKLSLEQFMQKRGSNVIVAQGRKKKAGNPNLFAAIEARYGVPAGPLIAIWGMETAFGRYLGDQDIFSSLTTLAYDCRRSAFFEEHLYGALQLLQTGQLSRQAMRGAGHGEIGQMQFLPANYVKYGVDGDGNGKVDMIGSAADALASTANFLRAHGWKRGQGYQPGEPNFRAIEGWNAAGVYQKAIAIMAKQIDG